MSDVIRDLGIRAYLVDLVNQREGLELDPEAVEFSEPELIDDQIVDFSQGEARNTSVWISQPASKDSPAVEIELIYNRLRLDKMFQLRSTRFAHSGASSLVDHLGAINERLNAGLTADDIMDVDLPGEGTFLLKANANSLYVFGEIPVEFGQDDETPVEDDDMHYIAYAPTIYQNVNGDGQQTTITISTDMGCGNPLRLISSAPETDEILAIEDLSQLVLEDSYVFRAYSHWQAQGMKFSTMDQALGSSSGSIQLLRAFYQEDDGNTEAFEEKYIVQEAEESYMVLAHPGDGGGFAFDGFTFICARLRFSHPQVSRPIYMYLVGQMPH